MSSRVIADAGVLSRRETPALLFLRHEPLGRAGRLFRTWNLRAMFDGAGVRVVPDGATGRPSEGRRFARVGGWLPPLSVGEFPQLLNVPVSDMTLAGQRPDLPQAFALFDGYGVQPLRMRCRTTGLVQVSGRNVLSLRRKWAKDVEYARSASLLLDAGIPLRVVGAILSRRGVFRPVTMEGEA